MQLTANQKRLMTRVVNVFETSTIDGDYSNISIYHDGPHDIRQITYGRSQTTEYGNLRRLVQDYASAGGMFSQQLQSYADRVGSVPLTDDANFKTLLRKAGAQDPIMRSTQDRFFDEIYFRPAMKWADQNGFTLPLSALVIYDSFIHSGSILWVIRNKFQEMSRSGRRLTLMLARTGWHLTLALRYVVPFIELNVSNEKFSVGIGTLLRCQ